jgi:hypothetical protein
MPMTAAAAIWRDNASRSTDHQSQERQQQYDSPLHFRPFPAPHTPTFFDPSMYRFGKARRDFFKNFAWIMASL